VITVAIDLIMNLALLVALSMISGFIRRRWERGLLGSALQGILFGGSAILAMLRPFVLVPGLIFDGRSVVVSLCGMFFGPLAAAIAVALAAPFRILLGGTGALTGVLVTSASALLGLLYYARWTRRKIAPSNWTLLRLGLAVHVVMLLLMFTPGGGGLGTIRKIGLPVIFIYPLVTVLIGNILASHIASMRNLEKLRQTEKILAEFMNHSPIHAFVKEVTASESRVLYASENYIDMIGIPGHDMIGRTMEELFPAEAAAKFSADDWRVVSRGEVLKLDEELNNRSYTTYKFPIHIGGKALLAGYTIDIHERIQTQRDLAEKELRLRTLLNSIPDLIWLKDTEGRYLVCNPMFERFIGVREADLIGRTAREFLNDEQAERFREGDLQALALGKEVRSEETIVFKDTGRRALVEVTKVPLLDGENRMVGVLGIAHDITERKRLEEERRQLELHLHTAQRLESIGSLAGGMAHDMNNVLGAIMGLASAHLEGQPAGSPAYRAFDTIIKAANRGGKMLRGLLSFARQSLAEERDLDINAILEEEAGLLERTTLSRVRLEMDLAPDLRRIRGDANALAHAIMNLCVNAVDAMPENGTLTLRTRNLGKDWIEVQVEDCGQGMTREVREKAVDPFFTTKQGTGTGLGLSQVYSTVKAHKGELEIRSEPDLGTTVILRFPALDAAGPPAAPAGKTGFTAELRKLNVLFVDDDELIRDTLKDMLAVLGYAAACAASGEEALALLEGGMHPDVVILDMNMPGLGGAGTLPRLRLLQPNVPVLLATGRADQAALDLIAAHDGVTLLAKPFGLRALQNELALIARD
jgi:PAS domain S-box-containing protein